MRLDPAHFRHAVGNRAPRPSFEFNLSSPLARGHKIVWPLWEGTGAAARDLGLYGANGTIENAPAWNANPFGGRMLQFNPALAGNQRVKIDPADHPFSTADLNAGGYTIAGWFIGDTASANASPAKQPFSLGDVAGLSWQHGNASFHKAAFHQDSLGGFISAQGPDLAAGTIYHIATRWKGSGALELFIDGELVATSGGTASDILAPTGNRNLSWGSGVNSSTGAAAAIWDGASWDFRLHTPYLGDAEIWGLYDPQTRWGIYRETAAPRVWPAAAGGATTRTSIGSLQAALQRQASLLASADAALRAESVLSALTGTAVAQTLSTSAGLDLAVQVVRQAQAALDTALTRALSRDAGLDANLTVLGAFQRGTALDGAIRRLNLLSGTLEAALRAPKLDTAALDAWLALNLEGVAGLDAAAQRGRQHPSTALQGILRTTPGRAAVLDAVIGLVVAAAASRTHKVGARGRNAVSGGRRQSVIPSGNRRH